MCNKVLFIITEYHALLFLFYSFVIILKLSFDTAINFVILVTVIKVCVCVCVDIKVLI